MQWDEGKDSSPRIRRTLPYPSLGGDGSKVSDAVVTLKAPKLEGGNLTFDVVVLEGSLAGSSGPAALFIDRFGGFYGGFHAGGYGGFHAVGSRERALAITTVVLGPVAAIGTGCSPHCLLDHNRHYRFGAAGAVASDPAAVRRSAWRSPICSFRWSTGWSGSGLFRTCGPGRLPAAGCRFCRFSAGDAPGPHGEVGSLSTNFPATSRGSSRSSPMQAGLGCTVSWATNFVLSNPPPIRGGHGQRLAR